MKTYIPLCLLACLPLGMAFVPLCLFSQTGPDQVLNRIGVQVHNMKPDQQLEVSDKLHTIWSRAAGLELDAWKTSDKEWTTYWNHRNRFNVHINRYSTNNTKPFAKNQNEINAWAANIWKVFKNYDPKLPDNVAFENEELNQNYHSGPMTDYIKMLDTATKIARTFGIRTTNGGFPEQVACQAVYRYYKYTLNNNKKANDWAAQTLDDGQKKSADNYAVGSNIRRFDTCMDAYRDMASLDMINIHIYYPWDKDKNKKPIVETVIPSDAFKQIADFVKWRTGKPCCSNETSIRHSSETLMKNFFDAYNMADWRYVIFNASEGGSAGEISLWDPGTQNLNAMGQYYSKYVDGYYGENIVAAQGPLTVESTAYKVPFFIVLALLILAIVAIVLLMKKEDKKPVQVKSKNL